MTTLLYCTDGSKYSQVCAEYTGWWAQRAGASVHALYVSDLRFLEVPAVADLSGSLGIQPYQSVMGQLQQMEETKAELVLGWAESYFQELNPPVPVRTTHRTGLLVDCLQDVEKDAEMIILGKRGENANFASQHLGSTLERVVRTTQKPCLVTSRKFEPIERAILAYDGGKSSRKALEYWISKSFLHDIDLHVVVVAENGAEDLALSRLKEAEGLLSAAGLSGTLQMFHGQPESVISEYVTDQNIHLLLMGAYGHSRIRHLIIGSTTTEMIRSCRIPVLLFR